MILLIYNKVFETNNYEQELLHFFLFLSLFIYFINIRSMYAHSISGIDLETYSFMISHFICAEYLNLFFYVIKDQLQF